jgi:hypothetical protein
MTRCLNEHLDSGTGGGARCMEIYPWYVLTYRTNLCVSSGSAKARISLSSGLVNALQSLSTGRRSVPNLYLQLQVRFFVCRGMAGAREQSIAITMRTPCERGCRAAAVSLSGGSDGTFQLASRLFGLVMGQIYYSCSIVY